MSISQSQTLALSRGGRAKVRSFRPSDSVRASYPESFPIFSHTQKDNVQYLMHVCVCYVVVILLQFLSDKNYPKMLTPRALQTPSTKEFLHILNVSVNVKKKKKTCCM